MLAEWGANLVAFTFAMVAARALGHASTRVTVLCLVGTWSVAGHLFLMRCPGADWGVLLKGSMLYLASLVLLLFCLARLDFATARAIAQWYDMVGLGGSVGLLIFGSGLAPAFFVLGPRRLRTRTGV